VLDGEAGAVGLDLHLGGRAQLLRRMAAAGEAEGERHVEAAGMGGREELFWVGALVVAKAHAGGIGYARKRPALRL
jgi:hypothetical protein